MDFVPNFNNPNPYSGAPPEYIQQIYGTSAYNQAVAMGWIQPIQPPVNQTPAPPSTPTPIPQQAIATPMQTAQPFVPDFTNPINPYEGAPPEYIQQIYGTPAYYQAVNAGWIQPIAPPPPTYAQPTPSQPPTDWKPDFTNPTNPYEGMPPEYAAYVGQTYVPTQANPFNPIQVAATQGLVDPKYIPTQADLDRANQIIAEKQAKELQIAKSDAMQKIQPLAQALGISGNAVTYSQPTIEALIKQGANPQDLVNAGADFIIVSSTLDKLYVELPDGKYISREVLDNLKNNQPELYKIATDKGFGELQKTIDLRNGAITTLQDKGYVDALGNISASGYAKLLNDFNKGEIEFSVLKNAGFKEEALNQVLADTQNLYSYQQKLESHLRAINETIKQLDADTSPEAMQTGKGLTGNESASLSNAMRKLGMTFTLSEPGVVKWRTMSLEDKQKVADLYNQDVYKSNTLASIVKSLEDIPNAPQQYALGILQSIPDVYDVKSGKYNLELAKSADKLYGIDNSLLVRAGFKQADIDAGKSVEPKGQITSALVGMMFAPITLPLSPIAKSSVGLPVSKQEIAVGIAAGVGDILSLGGASLITSPVATMAGLGIGGTFLGTTLADTIPNWNEMNPAQKKISVGTIGLIALPVAIPFGISGVKGVIGRFRPDTLTGNAIALNYDVGRVELPKGMSQLAARQLIADVERAQLTGKIPKERVAAYTDVSKGFPSTLDSIDVVRNLEKGTVDIVLKSADGSVIGHVSGSQRVFNNVLFHATGDTEGILQQIRDKGYFEASAEEGKHPVMYFSPQAAQSFMFRNVGDSPGMVAVRITPEMWRELPKEVMDSPNLSAMRNKMFELAREGKLEPGLYPLSKGYGSPLKLEYEVVIAPGTKLYPAEAKWYAPDTKGAPMTRFTSDLNYDGSQGGKPVKVGQQLPMYWLGDKSAISKGLGVPLVRDIYEAKLLGDLTSIRKWLPWNLRIRKPPSETQLSGVTSPNPFWSAFQQLKLKARPEDTGAGRVSAVIFNEKGEILLTRNQGADHFDLVGGATLKGENINKAVGREVFEETGMKPTYIEHVDTLNSVFKEGENPRKFQIFEVDVKGEPLFGKEVAEHIWWDGKSKLQYDVSPFTEQAINRLIERNTRIDRETVAKVVDDAIKKGEQKAKSGITDDAEAFINSIDAGGIPFSPMTANLARIARDNGIKVDATTTWKEVYEQLKAKRGSATAKEPTGNPQTSEEIKVERRAVEEELRRLSAEADEYVTPYKSLIDERLANISRIGGYVAPQYNDLPEDIGKIIGDNRAVVETGATDISNIETIQIEGGKYPETPPASEPPYLQPKERAPVPEETTAPTTEVIPVVALPEKIPTPAKAEAIPPTTPEKLPTAPPPESVPLPTPPEPVVPPTSPEPIIPPIAPESVVLPTPPEPPVLPTPPEPPIPPPVPEFPPPPVIIRPPIVPPVAPPLLKSKEGAGEKRVEIPYGALTWRQGNHWGYITKEELAKPDLQKEIVWLEEGAIPEGIYKYAEGKGSAYKTLQILPKGAKLESDAVVDMGWATVKIARQNGEPSIVFAGGKEAADQRWQEQKAQEAQYAEQGVIASDIPVTLRDEAQLETGLNKVLMPRYSTDTMKVYLVNGEYVRSVLSKDYPEAVDFTQGAHGRVYVYIPQDEIWIDRANSLEDRKATLLHELREYRAMGKGMEYSEAHNDVANPLELEARHNPQSLDEMITEELDNYRPTRKSYAVPRKQAAKVRRVSRQNEEYSEDDSVPSRSYFGRRLRPASLGIRL